jgi:hypothetical protein
MEIENIVEIAEDALMSSLCLQWYNETDEEKKQEIHKLILELYKKINEKKT